MHQSRVWRCAAGVILCVCGASAASAQFVKMVIREDKTLPPAPNLPAGIRTFNMYAQFAAAGTATGPTRINTVLSTGQPNGTLGFGINLQHNPGANFFQAPVTAGATANNVWGVDLPVLPTSGPQVNRGLYDSYVSIGQKYRDSTDADQDGLPDDPAAAADSTSHDPYFLFVNTDASAGAASLGLGAGHDFVRGGWLNGDPPALQGAATRDANNEFMTFLGQFSMAGLRPGANIGYWTGLSQPDPDRLGETAFTFHSEIFKGRLTVFRQENPFGVAPINISFIPAPASAIVLSALPLALSRRRRA